MTLHVYKSVKLGHRMGGNYSNSGLQIEKGIPGGMKRTKSKYKEKESFKIIFKKTTMLQYVNIKQS